MNRIKELRKEQKFTQKELADKLSVTVKTISRWESVEEPSIKSEKLELMSEIFGVQVSYLLNITDNRTEEEEEEELEKLIDIATEATPEVFFRGIDSVVSQVYSSVRVRQDENFFKLIGLAELRYLKKGVAMTQKEKEGFELLQRKAIFLEKMSKDINTKLHAILNYSNKD